jgi:hypothetical protein
MRNQNDKRRLERGASLVEMTCAVFLVTFGVMGVIQSSVSGLDHTRALAEYRIAARALENEIATLRALDFTALTPGADQPFRSNTPELEELHLATGSVKIRPADTSGLKEIRAQVRWIGEHGRPIVKTRRILIGDNFSGAENGLGTDDETQAQ